MDYLDTLKDLIDNTEVGCIEIHINRKQKKIEIKKKQVLEQEFIKEFTL